MRIFSPKDRKDAKQPRTTCRRGRLAEQDGLSVNAFVVRIIREFLGFRKPGKRSFNDLDHLAGTWSEKEYREFERNTSGFEAIDTKLWKP